MVIDTESVKKIIVGISINFCCLLQISIEFTCSGCLPDTVSSSALELDPSCDNTDQHRILIQGVNPAIKTATS